MQILAPVHPDAGFGLHVSSASCMTSWGQLGCTRYCLYQTLWELLKNVSSCFCRYQPEHPKAEVPWMNLTVIPGTTGIAHRRGAEVGRACLGLPHLHWRQCRLAARWLQGWPHGQQFCGQLEPQVNVHNVGETRVVR